MKLRSLKDRTQTILKLHVTQNILFTVASLILSVLVGIGFARLTWFFAAPILDSTDCYLDHPLAQVQYGSQFALFADVVRDDPCYQYLHPKWWQYDPYTDISLHISVVIGVVFFFAALGIAHLVYMEWRYPVPSIIETVEYDPASSDTVETN
jgi:hypothetical protein